MLPQEKEKKIKPGNSNKNIYDIILKTSLDAEDEFKLFTYVRKKNIKITMMIDQQARIWGPVVYILFNLVFGYAVSTHPI